MSDYGTHPTRYGSLSNNDLYAMYRGSVYSNLTENEKLDLLQETVNRDALERGEVGAPLVQFASLPNDISGKAGNGVIQVNYDMAVKGQQTFEYNGQTFVHTMDDHNIQALNTVIHENVHCFQDQVIDGTISIPDSDLTAQYQANGFTTSAVLQDGSYKLGSQYLTGESPGGYYMYYFQSTERDAYKSAEMKTDNILQGLSSKYGTEPSFEAYRQGVEVNGYQAMEQKATQMFNNPNFEQDLNQVLQNQYFGTNVPVDPNVERAVKNEMTETYQAMQREQVSQNNNLNTMEGNNMGFDPKPVSLEEYNQSLRDSVNSYYQHAMNDPTMSQDEAISSTAQTAENYLNAVDEFQAAQDAQLGTGNSANGNVSANNAVSNDGVSANDAVSNDGVSANDAVSNDESVDAGEDLDGGEDCDDGMDP